MQDIVYVVDRDPNAEYYIISKDGIVCPLLILADRDKWEKTGKIGQIPVDVHERLIELRCKQQEDGIYVMEYDESVIIEEILSMGYEVQQDEAFTSNYFDNIKDDESMLELALFFGTDLEMPL